MHTIGDGLKIFAERITTNPVKNNPHQAMVY